MKINKLTWSLFSPVLNKVKELSTGKKIRDSDFITYQNNQERLLRLLATESEFFRRVHCVRIIGGIKHSYIPKMFGSTEDEGRLEKFLSDLDKKTVSMFFEALESLMNEFNFGQEWKDPLLNYLINNTLDAPVVNCNLTHGKIGSRNRLFLEINDFTRKEDILAILPKLFRERDKLFPNKYRQYRSKNLSRGLMILYHTLENKEKALKQKLNKRQRESEFLTDAGIAEKIFDELDLDSPTIGEDDKKRKEIIKKARKHITSKIRREQLIRQKI